METIIEQNKKRIITNMKLFHLFWFKAGFLCMFWGLSSNNRTAQTLTFLQTAAGTQSITNTRRHCGHADMNTLIVCERLLHF